MSTASGAQPHGRVLVLMPTAKDGERTRQMLAVAALPVEVVVDMAALCARIDEGTGAILLTEEALLRDRGCLDAALAAQPAWSMIPLVVLSREGHRDASLAESAGITLVERPVRVRTLISVVRAALRARAQQYEIRDALAERERQAVAIAEQGEHLYFALSAGRLGSWSLSLPDQVLTTSELTRRILGHPADVALSYPDFIGSLHLGDQARVAASVEQVIADLSDLEVEYRVVWPDQSVHWVLARGRVLTGPDGKPERLAGIALDLTDLRQNEQALAETREGYRTLIEQVRDYAIFTVDTEGRAASWNVGVERVLGYVEEEFVGMPVAELFRPEDRAQGVHERELEAAAQAGSANNDRWMVKKGGAPFFAMGATTGLRDAHGKLIGFTKVMRDQTDWMQAQDELARSAQALKDADRRKDEFLATLAHELRNPLAPIRTGLQVLALDPQHEGSKRAKAVMERQLAHMVRLIDDLLDVSRITRGKVELKRQHLTVDAILDAAIEGSRPFVDAAKHTLTVQRSGHPLWVDGDPVRLSQVVSNLLHNAAKYTPRGGHITIRARAEDHEVVIEVQDDGVGIPPDQLNAVFEMFSQVNRTLERAQGGLGIGLALVSELVALHGGSIGAYSEGLGYGSTFTVRLPSAQPLVRSTAHSLPPTEVPAARRVLVVDDNVDGAETLAELLKMTGHDAQVVFDGPDALIAVDHYQPEVVFLDIGMPGMNGYEVARQLRARGCEATLIALTGWGSAADKADAMEAGFDSHLTKPVEPATVAAMLARPRRAHRAVG